jgi:hypothetical protein
MTFAQYVARTIASAVIGFFLLTAGGAHAFADSSECVPACDTASGYYCDNGQCLLNPITVTGSKGTTFAQFVEGTDGTGGLIGLMNTVLVPVIFVLAFLVFIWGIVKYFFIGGADEASRSGGRQFILWGLIGMVVLFSVWGLVNLLLSTLGLTPTS